MRAIGGLGRWRSAALLAVGGLAVAAGSAVAGHLGGTSFTGCLTTSGGTLSLVKEGDAPLKPCGPGSVVVHLGSGDITEVLAGTGLAGGGSSGSVGLAVAPSYRLPQSCTSSAIAEWSGTSWICGTDSDTQYTAGTGLDLVGGQFSIEPGYRVTNNQSCPAANFAVGINSSGQLQCAAPAATGAVFRAASPSVAVLDDGAYHVMVTTNLPAGTFALIGSVQIGRALSDGDEPGGDCELRSNGVRIDVVDTYRYDADFGVFNEHTLLGSTSLSSGGTVDIRCSSGGQDRDGIEAVAKVLAIKVN